MSLIGLLVMFIVFALAYWAIHRLAATFGLSDQIVGVIDVLLVVLVVLAILRAFGLLGSDVVLFRQ